MIYILHIIYNYLNMFYTNMESETFKLKGDIKQPTHEISYNTLLTLALLL